jgi:hypothetical protein
MRYSNYAAYAAQFPGKEVVDGMLWDTQKYTSGSTVLLTFFGATSPYLNVSNMKSGGQLPATEEFLIRSIRIKLKNTPESVTPAAAIAVQTGSIDDACLLLEMSYLQLNIGQKDYGIFPSLSLASGGGPFAIMSLDAGVTQDYFDYAVNGWPDTRNAFVLGKPILLKSQINFSVVMGWPAGAVTLKRDMYICVALDGDLIRAVQ